MKKYVTVWDFLSIGNSHKNFNIEFVRHLERRGVVCQICPSDFRADFFSQETQNAFQKLVWLAPLLRSVKFLWHVVFSSQRNYIILAVDNFFGLAALVIATVIRPQKAIFCCLHNNYMTLSRSPVRQKIVRYLSKNKIHYFTLGRSPQKDFSSLGIPTMLVLHPLPDQPIKKSTDREGIAVVGRGNIQPLSAFPELRILLESNFRESKLYVLRASPLHDELISSGWSVRNLCFYDKPQVSKDYFEFISARAAILLPEVYDSRGSVSGILLDALALSVPVLSYRQNILSDIF